VSDEISTLFKHHAKSGRQVMQPQLDIVEG